MKGKGRDEGHRKKREIRFWYGGTVVFANCWLLVVDCEASIPLAAPFLSIQPRLGTLTKRVLIVAMTTIGFPGLLPWLFLDCTRTLYVKIHQAPPVYHGKGYE